MFNTKKSKNINIHGKIIIKSTRVFKKLMSIFLILFIVLHLNICFIVLFNDDFGVQIC